MKLDEGKYLLGVVNADGFALLVGDVILCGGRRGLLRVQIAGATAKGRV